MGVRCEHTHTKAMCAEEPGLAWQCRPGMRVGRRLSRAPEPGKAPAPPHTHLPMIKRSMTTGPARALGFQQLQGSLGGTPLACPVHQALS